MTWTEELYATQIIKKTKALSIFSHFFTFKSIKFEENLEQIYN